LLIAAIESLFTNKRLLFDSFSRRPENAAPCNQKEGTSKGCRHR
jgi:hypothetical protein